MVEEWDFGSIVVELKEGFSLSVCESVSLGLSFTLYLTLYL